ncbi:hypothetical protein ACLB2K_029789 [Fragaria x ananassa]
MRRGTPPFLEKVIKRGGLCSFCHHRHCTLDRVTTTPYCIPRILTTAYTGTSLVHFRHFRNMSRPLSSCFLRVIKRSHNDQESLMSLVVVQPLLSINDAPGPYQISVKGSSLDPWEVSAVRLLVSLTFRDGWDSFAETYNIETDNCAMFVYEGLMHFTVIPFNKTRGIVDVDGGERFTVAVGADSDRALRGQNFAAEERFAGVNRNGVAVGGDPSGGGRRSSRRFVAAEARDLFPDDLPENYVVCVQKSDGRAWDTKVIKDCSTKALSSGFSNLVKSMGIRHKQKLQLHVVSNRHFVLE